MIIQFKSAPELGRLRVVSDEVRDKQESNACNSCDLNNANLCPAIRAISIACLSERFHFKKAATNE